MNMILGASYTVLTSICLYEDTGAFVERLGCGEVFIVLNTDGVKWSNVSVCQIGHESGVNVYTLVEGDIAVAIGPRGGASSLY